MLYILQTNQQTLTQNYTANFVYLSNIPTHESAFLWQLSQNRQTNGKTKKFPDVHNKPQLTFRGVNR